jgi:transporter family protein
MLWFYTALGSALLFSVLGIIAKKLMNQTSTLVYTTLYSLLATIFYIPFFLYFLATKSFSANPIAATALAASGVMNILAFLAFNTSIKEGEISKVMPFTRLTPIFTAIIGFLALGESLSSQLLTGIFLVTVGSYIVVRKQHDNILGPFRNLLTHDAPKIAVLASIFYGFASVIDRFATQQIQPEFYTLFIYIIMTSGFLIYIQHRETDGFKKMKAQLRDQKILYIITGICAAAASFLIFKAFSLAPASRVIPVLQIQVFITVIGGFLFFNEKNLAMKLIGSTILISGVVLVAL